MTPVLARSVGAIMIAVVAIASTGGLSAVGFWTIAVPAYLSVILASIGLGLALIPVLPLIPLGRALRRAMPVWGRPIDLGLRAVMALVPGTIYFLAEEALAVDGARLPAQDPGLGAVIVISMAALAYTALHLLTARLVVMEGFPRARPTSGPAPWGSTPLEPAEEFWSPQPVDGWRTWKWNQRVLRGSYETVWPTNHMEADCVVCPDPPGWECPCGIYALKDPGTLRDTRSGSEIVGRVELWGSVVEHEDGYRASHARITELWVEDAQVARWVALTYPEARVWLGSPPEEILVPPS